MLGFSYRPTCRAERTAQVERRTVPSSSTAHGAGHAVHRAQGLTHTSEPLLPVGLWLLTMYFRACICLSWNDDTAPRVPAGRPCSSTLLAHTDTLGRHDKGCASVCIYLHVCVCLLVCEHPAVGAGELQRWTDHFRMPDHCIASSRGVPNITNAPGESVVIVFSRCDRLTTMHHLPHGLGSSWEENLSQISLVDAGRDIHCWNTTVVRKARQCWEYTYMDGRWGF